jgi:hypothetical protein
MFDLLDCYILYICLFIPVLEALQPGRQTKQEVFFKKNPYVHRLTNIRAT